MKPSDDLVARMTEINDRLGLPEGTVYRQLEQESGFNPLAYNEGSQATGIAQFVPSTTAAWSKRAGRQLDPRSISDSLYMYEQQMRENLRASRGDTIDALRRYNSGWDPKKWNNPETNNYVLKVTGKQARQNAYETKLAAAQEQARQGNQPHEYIGVAPPNQIEQVLRDRENAATEAQRLADEAILNPVKKDSSILDLAAAAWRSENTIGSAIEAANGQRSTAPSDVNFSGRLQAHADGLDEYGDTLGKAKNPEDYHMIYDTTIAPRIRDRETIASHGVMGMAASIAAGTVADPVFWGTVIVAPEFGLARLGTTVGRFGALAVRGAAEAAATEIPLQTLDPTRSAGAGAASIAGSALMYGVVGKVVDRFSGAQREAIQRGIDEQLVQPAIIQEGAAAAERMPNSMPAAAAPASAGDTVLKTNAGTKVASAAVGPFAGIALRMAESEQPFVRKLGAALVSDTFQRAGTAKNIENVTSAEQRRNILVNQTAIDQAQALSRLDNVFKKNVEFSAAEKDQLFEQLTLLGAPVRTVDDVTKGMVDRYKAQIVTLTARSGERHLFGPIDEAVGTMLRNEKRLGDEMVRVGLRDTGFAPGSTLRLANKEMIRSNPSEFVRVFSPYIRDSLIQAEMAGVLPASARQFTTDPDRLVVTLRDYLLSQNVQTQAGSIQEAFEKMAKNGIADFKGVTFNLPEGQTTKFYLNDPMAVARTTARQYAPRIGLKEALGVTDFSDVQRMLREEKVKQVADVEVKKYVEQTPITQGGAGRLTPEQVKINADFDARIKKIEQDFAIAENYAEAAFNRINYRAGTAVTEGSAAWKAIQLRRTISKFIGPVMLGAQVLSSVPEVARLAMTHRLTPLVGNGLAAFGRVLRGVDQRTQSQFGTAAELALYQQEHLGGAAMREAMESGDMTSMASGTWSKIHGRLDQMNGFAQKYFGAMHFNDIMRSTAANTSQDRLLRLAKDFDGNFDALPKADREWMLVMGTGPEKLAAYKKAAFDPTNVTVNAHDIEIAALRKERATVLAEAEERGMVDESLTVHLDHLDSEIERLSKDTSRRVEQNGATTIIDGRFYNTDTSLWKDRDAARWFSDHVYKDSMHTVNAPNAGTAPVWADNELAKIFLGFQNFAFSGLNQTLIPGLQRNDARTYMAWTAMLGLGLAVGITRDKILNGRTPDKEYTATEATYLALDKSGLLGPISIAANVADRFAGSLTGYNFLPSGSGVSYKGQYQGLESILGPEPAFLGSAFRLTRDAVKGKKSGAELAEQGSKLLPFQNAWGFHPYSAALSAFGETSKYLDNVEKGASSTFIDRKVFAPVDTEFLNKIGSTTK